MTVSPAQLKRWLADQRAVESRIVEARRSLTPAESLRKALRVTQLQHQISGPSPATPIDEVLQVHRQWVKLRSRIAAG